MNTFFKSTFFKKNETLLAITALILSGVLFVFMPNCQSSPSEMVISDWTFEHCTPTNKDCGRLE